MKKQKDNFKTDKQIYDFWEKGKLFRADPLSGKKPYSLLIPPPNLTGELHLGHAMQHSILDALARYKRLSGFDALLLPGVDHAGILFEATLNKNLEKRNLSKEKLGREKWLEEAWKFKNEIYNSVSNSWRLMGLSADWSREVFTLDDGPRQAVFEEFKTYYDRELIYKGLYIVQWCHKCNTAIEDVEVEYEEREDKLYYVKYPLVVRDPPTLKLWRASQGPADAEAVASKPGTRDYITIATVRLETMFADVAVAVNPKDKRFKDLIGKKVNVPFVNRGVPIIADSSVDTKFGSGALKIDPAHSLEDFKIGEKHNLEVISVIGKDGRLNKNAGKFAGKKAFEAREEIYENLKKQGLIEKVVDLKHTVPVCERCKSITELLISEEWFVKVGKLARGAVKVINQDEIKFLPKNYKKILVVWLKDIHDWCISRSLWWGHRIPVWYPPKGETGRGKDPSTHSTSSGQASSGPDGMKVSLDSPGKGWKQDEQVLDTWFSSGLWPMSTLGWGDKSQRDGSKWKELSKYFPWDFEIIFLFFHPILNLQF